MLVLTRKPHEKVILTLPDGSRLTVTPVVIRGDQVRLGFQVPENVTVEREELRKNTPSSVTPDGVSPKP